MMMKLFMLVAALMATSVSATITIPPTGGTISGYWGSIKGGEGTDFPQRFACTGNAIFRTVLCTGVNVPDGAHPIKAPVDIAPVIAVGQRIGNPTTAMPFPVWQLDFSGEFGGTYILVAYNNTMIVNFTPDQAIPAELPADLTELFVWKLIAR
jgi:hypothetical protein